MDMNSTSVSVDFFKYFTGAVTIPPYSVLDL